NPAKYNGFKVSGPGVVPVGGDSGLARIEEMARAGIAAPPGVTPGRVEMTDVAPAYGKHVASLLRPGKRRLKVAGDCGNGLGGLEVKNVLSRLPFDLVGLYLEPDGTFPNHEANPLNPATMRDLHAA